MVLDAGGESHILSTYSCVILFQLFIQFSMCLLETKTNVNGLKITCSNNIYIYGRPRKCHNKITQPSLSTIRKRNLSEQKTAFHTKNITPLCIVC